MITKLKLKFGRHPGTPPEDILVTPVTVFVGPNNSGKSRVLTEINELCRSGQRNAGALILDSLELAPMSPDAIEDRITRVTLPLQRGDAQQPGHIIVGKRGARLNVSESLLRLALTEPNGRLSHFCNWFLAYNTLILDGPNRISLVSEQNAGDLQREGNSSFQVLFREDHKRAEVRRIIYDAFKSYFVIDPTHIGKLRVRLSPTEPPNNRIERGWDAEAVSFHSRAQLINEASDGVKAFTGMITEIVAGDPIAILIDEPEAFLHPALAHLLGKEIAKTSSGSEKRLFVATHSPTFVMGCLQSGAPVNIVRLTYLRGVATARVLPSAEVLRLMRNPLLRSTGVISALFYEFVIVTESDTDRAFYQEINERLLRTGDGLGIPNCLFLNAQNKQTVHTIMRPLRHLGIPAAAIVDIDVLKEGGTVWASFLDAGNVPEIDKQSLATARAALMQKFQDSGRNMKRDGGIELLSDADRESALNLLRTLAGYGLFVVPHGELEAWLKNFNVTGHGPEWLIGMFERLGDDPADAQYARPGEGDVWGFLATMRTWFFDPERRGIPS
jgi:hypothetical protein